MQKYRTLIVNIKQNEKLCLDFINKQDNYTNAIKFLIMKEVKENGLRNLNNFIPANVSEDYFDLILMPKAQPYAVSPVVTPPLNKEPAKQAATSNQSAPPESTVIHNNVDSQPITTPEAPKEELKIPDCYL